MPARGVSQIFFATPHGRRRPDATWSDIACPIFNATPCFEAINYKARPEQLVLLGEDDKWLDNLGREFVQISRGHMRIVNFVEEEPLVSMHARVPNLSSYE